MHFFTTETQVVRKNRSAGVSPASEPRQLLLGQHDLCRLEPAIHFFSRPQSTRRRTENPDASVKSPCFCALPPDPSTCCSVCFETSAHWQPRSFMSTVSIS